MSQGIHHESCKNYARKVHNRDVIDRCIDCGHYDLENYACSRGGRAIDWPVSGPIPAWCHLETVGDEDCSAESE